MQYVRVMDGTKSNAGGFKCELPPPVEVAASIRRQKFGFTLQSRSGTRL